MLIFLATDGFVTTTAIWRNCRPIITYKHSALCILRSVFQSFYVQQYFDKCKLDLRERDREFSVA
jgi:hypothetical protein